MPNSDLVLAWLLLPIRFHIAWAAYGFRIASGEIAPQPQDIPYA